MITNTLLVISLGLAAYLLIGFRFLSGSSFIRPITASIFNGIKKNIYPTNLEERVKKEVVTIEEYEWIKSDSFGVPIGVHENY